MLENIHTGQVTGGNIHRTGVGRFRQAVGEEAYQKITDWMLAHFERQEWVNTSWVAPKNWLGTELEPIWDYFGKVQDHDERHDLSAKLYGCIFYTVLYDQPRIYLYHRPEGHHADDKRPFGLTYRLKD